MHGYKYISFAMLIVASWAFGQPPTLAPTIIQANRCPLADLVAADASSKHEPKATVAYRKGPSPDETLEMPREIVGNYALQNPRVEEMQGGILVVPGENKISSGGEAEVFSGFVRLRPKRNEITGEKRPVAIRVPRQDPNRNFVDQAKRREVEEKLISEMESIPASERSNILLPLAIEGEYQVLPYLPRDLEGLAGEFSTLPFSKQVDLSSQLSGALGSMHSRLWVHRDTKLANVRVDGKTLAEGHLVLSDFGLAAPIDYQETGIYGSYGYMHWNQIAGGKVKPYFDVYAFGRILDELILGKPINEIDGKDIENNSPNRNHTYTRKMEAWDKEWGRELRFSSYTTALKANTEVDSRQELLSTIAMLAQSNTPVIQDGKQLKTYIDALGNVEKGKEKDYYRQYLQEPLDSLPVKELAILIGRDPKGLGKRYLNGDLPLSPSKKQAIGEYFNQWVESENHNQNVHSMERENPVLAIVEPKFAKKWNKSPGVLSKVFKSMADMGKKALGRPQ